MPDPSDIRASHLRATDFLGAFAVIRRAGKTLFVANERVVGGQPTVTWDLPGGQVEPGELLGEALRRELHEELAIEVEGEPEFLFLQEGERRLQDARRYAWRSFFFAVERFRGEPTPGNEIRALRWLSADEEEEVLRAPYHDSYLAWRRGGGALFTSRWVD